MYLFSNTNFKFLESSKLRWTKKFQKRENCGNKRYRSSDDFNKFTIQLKVMFLLWHNIFFYQKNTECQEGILVEDYDLNHNIAESF